MVDVLLVENSGENADFIIFTLTTIYAEIDIEWVPTAQEALDFIFATGLYKYRAAHPLPKILLLSTICAEDSPLDIIPVLKSSARTQHLPIVVVSDTPDKAATLAGATCCLEWDAEIHKFISSLEVTVVYWLMTPLAKKTGNTEEHEQDDVADASERNPKVYYH